MANFGVGGHAHTEAALSAILLTLLVYGAKWLLGLKFPALILGLPAFLALFAAFYLILFVVFLILWSRK